MAKYAPITRSKRWFQSEDKTLRWDVVDDADAALDVSAFTLRVIFEYRDQGEPDLLVIEDAAITVSAGVGTNDRAAVTLADTDIEGWDLKRPIVYALRRVDAGAEALLAWGEVQIHEAPVKG